MRACIMSCLWILAFSVGVISLHASCVSKLLPTACRLAEIGHGVHSVCVQHHHDKSSEYAAVIVADQRVMTDTTQIFWGLIFYGTSLAITVACCAWPVLHAVLFPLIVASPHAFPRKKKSSLHNDRHAHALLTRRKGQSCVARHPKPVFK